ncbi:MAG: HU family DNA-binding protein [Betaproteobacteria bacterium AqS2]|uniref:HU family DNA-binding protein n=1 Tax=Candidatus Amphirhobacter heronislandensis TaxID=1732024 RepID=A0A930XYH1_9GAMM|nr:HU family DNA-binding protein [Betaproteobacteria bacterium AqS2]
MAENEAPAARTLTRQEIIASLRGELGSFAAAKRLLQSYFDLIEAGLVADGVVKLHNFGRFETSGKKARMGRNPRSGEAKVIEARTIVKFRPCSKLRNSVRHPVPPAAEEDHG